jgi:predicted flap endonuclease-1-like 5' DNA nuclease
MGILDTLLTMLGLGRSSSDGEGTETTVSTEREVDADTESAVKGTDGVDEAVAAETDAAASTESLVEERDATAEPAEATGPDDEDGETELDTVEAESAGETTGEHEVVDEGARESTEVIKGIGPAYAERLSKAGIESVADLADADPAELPSAVDLSEKRIGRWIERARDR